MSDSGGRRQFLQVGAGALAAAVLAACGKSSSKESASTTDSTQTVLATDASVLRTLTSVALFGGAVYSTAADRGFLATEIGPLFQKQHQQHAATLQSATKKAGGTPVDQPNAALVQQFQGRLGAAKDEAAFSAVAMQVERVLLATYLSTIGTFSEGDVDLVVMSIAGVAARHAAMLATLAKQPPAPSAVATSDGGVSVTGTP